MAKHDAESRRENRHEMEQSDGFRAGVSDVLGAMADWGDAGPDPGSTGLDTDCGFEFADPYAGRADNGAELSALDLVGDQEGDALPCGGSAQLASAAQRHLPNARKGTRKKAFLISFCEEDFEAGPERDAFTIIRSFKNDLFASGARPEQRWRAIEWFFTIADNGKDATFALCCQALGARIDVVRLRIHYEFFLRWWIAPRDFPFLTVPVPDLIDGEVAYIAGEAGRDLATVAWTRPGIETQELLRIVNRGQEAGTALERLADRFIMSEQSPGHWYLTGRNPLLLRTRLLEQRGNSIAQLGGSIYWSRLL